MNIPNFGDKIKVVAKLVREKVDNKRNWVRVEFPYPAEAVFVIKRTLANGTMEGVNDEDGPYFSGTEFLPSAIVGIKGIGVEKVLLSDIIFVCGLCGK